MKKLALVESIKSLKYFQREKCFSTTSNARARALWSLLYPQGPSVGLCNMDIQCLHRECLSIQFSEARIIIMKFQTITLTHGHKYNLIFQGDHREDIQMFMLCFVSNLYFLQVRASMCHLNILPTKSNNIINILLIL